MQHDVRLQHRPPRRAFPNLFASASNTNTRSFGLPPPHVAIKYCTCFSFGGVVEIVAFENAVCAFANSFSTVDAASFAYEIT